MPYTYVTARTIVISRGERDDLRVCKKNWFDWSDRSQILLKLYKIACVIDLRSHDNAYPFILKTVLIVHP